MSTYYARFSINYDEKFSNKEFSPQMVVEAIKFCVDNGKIETVGIDETQLVSNVYFSAVVNGEFRLYRFYNGNVVALRRMYWKFCHIAFKF